MGQNTKPDDGTRTHARSDRDGAASSVTRCNFTRGGCETLTQAARPWFPTCQVTRQDSRLSCKRNDTCAAIAIDCLCLRGWRLDIAPQAIAQRPRTVSHSSSHPVTTSIILLIIQSAPSLSLLCHVRPAMICNAMHQTSSLPRFFTFLFFFFSLLLNVALRATAKLLW